MKTEAETSDPLRAKGSRPQGKLGQALDGVSFGASEGNRLAFGLLASEL